MRAAIVATFAFALAACSSSNSNNHGNDGGADGGPADSMTSDGVDSNDADNVIPCNGEGICYASDCKTIAMCTDIGTCLAGQLYPDQCFGPDAGRDR